MNEVENYVIEKFNNKLYDWFPVSRSLTLESKQQKSNEDFLTLQKSVKTLSEDFRSFRKELLSKYKDRDDDHKELNSPLKKRNKKKGDKHHPQPVGEPFNFT
eukprot:CAMPEP_0176462336 /NCGR_PEP_ID=MMETSP0127-20121128/35199_1 /TAXON_ID=938130 /ORGANISM="Platyophrya macrostoma, Strain WH" /LENGTH=101 /DNA_ID=CAMNT_0017854219 /DNA_START=110 /DNA_END=415 /DNA_ORIENTATION=+